MGLIEFTAEPLDDGSWLPEILIQVDDIVVKFTSDMVCRDADHARTFIKAVYKILREVPIKNIYVNEGNENLN